MILSKRALTLGVFLLAPACIEVGRLRSTSGDDDPSATDDDARAAAGAPPARSGGSSGYDTGGNAGSLAGGSGASGGSFSPSEGHDADPITGGGGAHQGPIIPPGTRHKSISAGSYHTCITLEGGHAECWGNNTFGQIGDDSKAPPHRAEPTPVAQLSGVKKVVAGAQHSCALLEAGTVRCWGEGKAGQLARGPDLTPSYVPKDVIGVERAIDLDAGYNFNCALHENKQISCWGSDGEGQLGNNLLPSDPRNPPTLVDGIDNAVGVVAGGSHACAILEDGTAKCWGWNAYGQIGSNNPDAVTRSTPDLVIGLDRIVKLSAGLHNTCAILADGTLWCWGYGDSAALGGGRRSDSAYVPVKVPGLSDVQDVSVGEYHVCAILPEGKVRCWGADDWGQVGDAANTGERYAEGPREVLPGFAAVELALGGFHSCARGISGEIACWGHNEFGSVGSGASDRDQVWLPTRVKGY